MTHPFRPTAGIFYYVKNFAPGRPGWNMDIRVGRLLNSTQQALPGTCLGCWEMPCGCTMDAGTGGVEHILEIDVLALVIFILQRC